MADMKTVAAATAIVFTLGLVCFTPLGFAQQPESAVSADSLKKLSIEQLMNLQVTSVSKRPERLSQTASAIQGITQEGIQRSGAASLPEALRLATNLQVAQLDSRQWAISARGFNGTAANKLLVLIDGRTVYTPLFSGVFWDVQEVPLADIDRIEVISGPGATLWGANAVNGVINVITKDAKDTQGLLLSGGGGTEQHGFGTVRYGAALGPSVRARFYGRGFDRDATAFPGGQGAADDWYLGQGGFRMDWDASSGTRVTLQGDLYDGRIAQDSGGDIAVSGRNVMAKWSHTLSGRSSLAAHLYYDRTHRDIPGLFGEDLDTYDVDLQHRTRLGDRHDVVWGLGYRNINDRTAIGSDSTPAFLPLHVAREGFTGFVQDEIALHPNRFHLTLGTKIEHNDYTGFEVQPSGRVNWRLSPSATLWAAVSRAVRAPSRVDRELFAPAKPPYVLAGGPDFHSEEELAYELGYRRHQGSLALSVATFYSRYHGLRSLEQVNPPTPVPLVIGNGQDGESYGAELTAEYWLTNRWRVHGGDTQLRVHVWPNPRSPGLSKGATEAQIPDRQFLLLSSVDLPAHLGLAAWFRAIDDINNQLVPAYAELNVTLTWQPTSKLDLSLVGQNLLHDRHREFGAPPANPTAPDPRRDIQRGVYGTVAWHF